MITKNTFYFSNLTYDMSAITLHIFYLKLNLVWARSLVWFFQTSRLLLLTKHCSSISRYNVSLLQQLASFRQVSDQRTGPVCGETKKKRKEKSYNALAFRKVVFFIKKEKALVQ